MTNATNYREIYEPKARTIAQRYGVPEEMFVRLITNESGWNPQARSEAGAVGFGQLMPETARELGVNPYNPDENLEGAAKYLAALLKGFGNDPQKAIAAYVAGPGTVAKAIGFGDGAGWYERYLASLGEDAAPVESYITAILTDTGAATSTTTSRTASQSSQQLGQIPPPNLDDFEIFEQDPFTGEPISTGAYDWNSYYEAVDRYETLTQGTDNDFTSFLDDAIASIGLDLDSGALTVSQAKQEFDRRIEAKKAGSDLLVNTLGYAIPRGMTTIPGTDRDISGRTLPLNPFAIYDQIVNSTPDLTQVYQAPSGQDTWQQAISMAQGMQGAQQAQQRVASGGNAIVPPNAGGNGAGLADPRAAAQQTAGVITNTAEQALEKARQAIQAMARGVF